MGRKKNVTNSLGKSLMKGKRAVGKELNSSERHAIHEEEQSGSGLKSVTEETSYEEFIATATLSQKEFTAEKLNSKFVVLSTSDASEDTLTSEDIKHVVVPRRPKWTSDMTPEELDELEREAFLQWRRSMAHLQNKEGITPFERNLEVWRQLWRVVEKSHIVVQIVDARNPLLYRSEDLEKYVTDLGKKNILLINKSDYLTVNQRELWTDYFQSINLSHAFFSALEKSDQNTNTTESTQSQKSPVLNRKELIEYLKGFKVDNSFGPENPFCVGLVGYPNVGKSSTINNLMSQKKTSVSSTPGKTKHFQTLFLEDDLLLCDCPGLVMPAFGGSKGEMVLGGILPIDQLTSYSSGMELLTNRISRTVLERRYGITLPNEYSHDDVLNAYASIRGFMTVRGIPDASRAARIILKDYVNGKLLYSHEPPNVERKRFAIHDSHVVVIDHCLREEEEHQTSDPEKERPANAKTIKETSFDSNFFRPLQGGAHIKGRTFVSTGDSQSAFTSTSSLADKPWKKHNNHNKREKARRVYKHLDV